MLITNFEDGQDLGRACLHLHQAEAEELVLMLRALLRRPEVGHSYLTELNGAEIVRELTVCLQPGP